MKPSYLLIVLVTFYAQDGFAQGPGGLDAFGFLLSLTLYEVPMFLIGLLFLIVSIVHLFKKDKRYSMRAMILSNYIIILFLGLLVAVLTQLMEIPIDFMLIHPLIYVILFFVLGTVLLIKNKLTNKKWL